MKGKETGVKRMKGQRTEGKEGGGTGREGKGRTTTTTHYTTENLIRDFSPRERALIMLTVLRDYLWPERRDGRKGEEGRRDGVRRGEDKTKGTRKEMTD